MIIDYLNALLPRFPGDLAGGGLRQKMSFDHVAAFAVSDQAALASDDRSGQLKLALETDAVLVASSGRDDPLCPIFIQPADSGGILFADCFVRPEECAIQIDRSQPIRELCCRLNIVFHFLRSVITD